MRLVGHDDFEQSTSRVVTIPSWSVARNPHSVEHWKQNPRALAASKAALWIALATRSSIRVGVFMVMVGTPSRLGQTLGLAARRERYRNPAVVPVSWEPL